VGSYPGSASPYGTFDQGGNGGEINETIFVDNFADVSAGNRGGSAYGVPDYLAARWRDTVDPSVDYIAGFRVASLIPEPGTGVLVIAGLIGLAMRSKARH
jgi:hypothetical protein